MKNMNIKQFLAEKIKIKFFDWSQSVTYHCFAKIFKSKYNFLAKTFYSIIFLVFTGLTSYVLISNVIAYFKYDVISTLEVVNEKPVIFPKVTICNTNPFTSQQAEYLLKTQILDNNLNIQNSNFFKITNEIKSAIAFAKSVVNNPEYGDENRKLLGFNLKDLILDCSLNQIKCDLNRDVHWFFHYDYGNCYQFNSGYNLTDSTVKLSENTFEGITNGLSLRFGPVVNYNSLTGSFPARGLQIFIGNQSFEPSYFDTSLTVKSGESTNIGVKRTFYSKLPSPYSNCINSNGASKSEFYNFLINSKKTYRQKDCFYLSFQKTIIESCQCYFTAFLMLYNSPPCLNKTQIECFNTRYKSFVYNIKENYDVFLKDCPLECDSVEYELQITSLDFPTKENYNLFKNDLDLFAKTQNKFNISLSTFEEYKTYYYSVNIFYVTTQYTLISESPQMTFTGLLTNLGGSLGMFLGFSVFSLLEVFEILFEIALILIFKKDV